MLTDLSLQDFWVEHQVQKPLLVALAGPSSELWGP